MEKDILGRVIEVEKEIQERLREEKRKSVEWLDNVRKETEADLSKEEERLRAGCTKAIDETAAEAGRRGVEIMRASDAEAEALARMSDEALEEIFLKYIPRIFPSVIVSAGNAKKAREPS